MLILLGICLVISVVGLLGFALIYLVLKDIYNF